MTYVYKQKRNLYIYISSVILFEHLNTFQLHAGGLANAMEGPVDILSSGPTAM